MGKEGRLYSIGVFEETVFKRIYVIELINQVCHRDIRTKNKSHLNPSLGKSVTFQVPTLGPG